MTDGTPNDEAPALQRVSRVMAAQLLAIGVIAFLGLLLWFARDALAPYLLGMLLVYMLLPIVHSMVSTAISTRRQRTGDSPPGVIG